MGYDGNELVNGRFFPPRDAAWSSMTFNYIQSKFYIIFWTTSCGNELTEYLQQAVTIWNNFIDLPDSFPCWKSHKFWDVPPKSGEDGLELLRRALPPAIHVTAENSKEGTAVMQSFLVSLCNQVRGVKRWHWIPPKRIRRTTSTFRWKNLPMNYVQKSETTTYTTFPLCFWAQNFL